MFNKFLFVVLFIMTIFMTSCSKNNYELKILVNPWIGYSPLYYLNETGMLKDLNVKLIHTVSLSNSKDFLIESDVPMVAGTQYEYQHAIKNRKQLYPVVLFDRSFGGDIVMSNVTLDQLKKAQHIDIYLEVESINRVLLDSFVKKHNIDMNILHYINIDQSRLSGMKLNEMESESILITYTPYDVKLKKNGFIELASTQTDTDLLIFDALFVDEHFLNDPRLKTLKEGVDIAIKKLNENPKEYYKKVKTYLDSISYEEFIESLDKIQWINDTKDIALIESINDNGISTQHLIK